MAGNNPVFFFDAFMERLDIKADIVVPTVDFAGQIALFALIGGKRAIIGSQFVRVLEASAEDLEGGIRAFIGEVTGM